MARLAGTRERGLMLFRRILRFASLAAVSIAALAIAQPTLAFTQTGTTGTTGAHSVPDTSSNTAAVCSYQYLSSENVWKLKHIFVDAPYMKAVPGMGSEKVAWNFTVQRREGGFSGFGPWHNRYTSPNFSAMTDSTQNAPLVQEGVRVTVPFAPGADAAAEYRVLMKMIWYKANGTSVLGTVSGRLNWYSTYLGIDTFTRHNLCFDYEA
jgi:hypothetical protein